MIAVIDYGGGNTGSLLEALRRQGADAQLVADAATLERADAAILPGDGAFAATMDALGSRALLPAILRFINDGKPFLGICVGMQILFEGSDEFGGSRGLGVFPGQIRRFSGQARVPHIGWSKLEIQRDDATLCGVAPGAYAYFMHSYRAPVMSATIALAQHDGPFSAVVVSDNVTGMQFHPEKSQQSGAQLLRNFLKERCNV